MCYKFIHNIGYCVINPHALKRLVLVKVMQLIVINGILCKNRRNLST
jgi:hypothetical protein